MLGLGKKFHYDHLSHQARFAVVVTYQESCVTGFGIFRNSTVAHLTSGESYSKEFTLGVKKAGLVEHPIRWPELDINRGVKWALLERERDVERNKCQN